MTVIAGLPEAFTRRMRDLLKDEYEAFAASYAEPRHYGLRVNRLKLEPERFAAAAPFALEPIAWAPEGFYYREDDRPGKHPYYHAGLYYIQEPSAMAPAEQLNVRPGDKVLDLCAAPGGKSMQIAAKLQGEGLLVSNDNAGERVKALVKNIETAGVRNAVVLNETPERLQARFAGFFDKILIDAPCSGEGMFRKEPDMAKQWERHSVERCSLMQRQILRAAVPMLAPGGTLVYSTCTFSPEENEARIAECLADFPELEVVPIGGFAPGRPDWIGEAGSELAGTARLWPHRLRGEGHYIAALRRRPSSEGPEGSAAGSSERRPLDGRKQPNRLGKQERELIRSFMDEHLTIKLPLDRIVCYGSYAYIVPEAAMPELDGLKVARPGWFIGTLKPKRFEPSHALALGLRAEEAARRLAFKPDEPDVIRYLKGETLQADERVECADGYAANGYVLVCVDQYPLGWAKRQPGVFKNEYPPGWRWT